MVSKIVDVILEAVRESGPRAVAFRPTWNGDRTRVVIAGETVTVLQRLSPERFRQVIGLIRAAADGRVVSASRGILEGASAEDAIRAEMTSIFQEAMPDLQPLVP